MGAQGVWGAEVWAMGYRGMGLMPIGPIAHVPHWPCDLLPMWPIPLVPYTPCAAIAHVAHTL